MVRKSVTILGTTYKTMREAAASFGVSPASLRWRIKNRALPAPKFDPHSDETCDLKLWPLGLRVADVVAIRKRLDAGGDAQEIADDHCIMLRSSWRCVTCFLVTSWGWMDARHQCTSSSMVGRCRPCELACNKG